MIDEKIIGGKIFVAQTTFHVYSSLENRKKGICQVVTSDPEVFKLHQKAAKEEWERTTIRTKSPSDY